VSCLQQLHGSSQHTRKSSAPPTFHRAGRDSEFTLLIPQQCKIKAEVGLI